MRQTKPSVTSYSLNRGRMSGSLYWLLLLSLISLSVFGCAGHQEKGAAAAQGGLSDELNVYNWSEYIGETTIEDFEREFGVNVNYDNYASNEELLAKLQAGAAGYDVIVPSDYMVQIMIKEGLLAELDFENIPNFDNIDERFKNLPYDPENRYSVPYQWGIAGIGVDTTRVQNVRASWDMLWDPAYAQQITMLDDIRSGLVPALKKLGYSVNTTDPAHIEAAKGLMLEQKPLVKAYTSESYMDLLRSGEATISYVFSGADIRRVAADNPGVKFIIPMEGSDIWIDNMAIPKSAPHKRTAEAFINYMLRPEVGAGITNSVYYASPNAASRPHIHDEILNDPGIYPSEEVLEKSEFLIDVGEATRLYDRTWREIKAQ